MKTQTKPARPFKDLLGGGVREEGVGFNFGKAEIGISASQAISGEVIKQPY